MPKRLHGLTCNCECHLAKIFVAQEVCPLCNCVKDDLYVAHAIAVGFIPVRHKSGHDIFVDPDFFTEFCEAHPENVKRIGHD